VGRCVYYESGIGAQRAELAIILGDVGSFVNIFPEPGTFFNFTLNKALDCDRGWN
jgi:hypothetical protein